MRCPRCQNTLLSVEEDRIFSHLSYKVCEKCGGLWLDREGLDKLALQTYGSVELGSVVDLTDTIEEREGEILPHECLHVHRDCPTCRGRMFKMRFMGDSSIILDYCRGCGGIWLGRGDLERINAHIQWMDRNAVPSQFGRFLRHEPASLWHRMKTKRSQEDEYAGTHRR